jgi:CDP-diacylglycerol---glycerol-3-phosphate 3-phosphatidyltransferase
VTVLRFVVIRRGVIAASQGGKLKTLLQVAAICLYILPASLSPPAWVREVVMAVAVVVTLVTGADYVVRAVRLYRGPAGPRSGANGTSASGGNGGGADG